MSPERLFTLLELAVVQRGRSFFGRARGVRGQELLWQEAKCAGSVQVARREACEGQELLWHRKRSAQKEYRSLGARRARARTALALEAKFAGSVRAKNAATSGHSAAVDAE